MRRTPVLSALGWIAILALFALTACAPVGQQATTVPTAAPSATSAPVPTKAPATTAASPTTAVASPTTAATPSGAGTPTVATSPTAGTASSATPASASGAGIKFVLDPSKSEASYSIREQLAKLTMPNDAIGRTNAIAGSITLKPDGTVDSANSKITVDVSTLKSDEGMRDNYVRNNILQTGQYPQVVFVPTQISGLPAALPTSGNVSFKVIGDLTIRNVTKPVTWDVTGSVNNGVATGTATTSFTFAEFNLTQPRVSVVLSVVDKITLNANVTFSRASQ